MFPPVLWKLLPCIQTLSLVLGALFLLFAPSRAVAQESSAAPALLATKDNRFRLHGEVKLDFRYSKDESVRVFSLQGQDVFQRTVSPGSSFEVSNAALIGEGDLAEDLTAKVEIHFIDLYSRNPTSSADPVAVREAWLRFGKKVEGLRAFPGTTFYVQAGKAPRFSKQTARRLESYGLWGTAVGRLEELGLETGGSFGKTFYWRASFANGNPLFMRDTNALAGDNGTPERRTVEEAAEYGVYNSGFPILYDGKSGDLNMSGKFQVGGGLGFRVVSPDGKRGIDVVGWIFRRKLAEKARLQGTFYSGDLGLISPIPGVAPGLDFTGNDKTDVGANLEVRWDRLQLYAQYVYQDIAGLVRRGYEVELAYRFPLNGLFAVGDTPWFNWIQPDVRVSRIDNDFGFPQGFVAPSFAWNWTKVDAGFRVGIVRGVDLTAEYARHDMILRTRVLHPDELLVTLRGGF